MSLQAGSSLPSPSPRPWWKGGKRAVPPTAQDEFLALCLVMLSKNSHQPPPPPPLKLSHKCSVCNKAFSSYQALGGHKSSHRRPSALELARRPVSSGWSSGGGAAHQCTICHRSFATGQALGGHKRCHYWDTSTSGSAVAAASSGTGTRDFDLNLPAAPEQLDWVGEGEGEEEVMSPHPIKKRRF